MLEADVHSVEKVILEELEKVKGLSSVDTDVEINSDCKPGAIGIRSQVLVSIMGNLEEILNVTIPDTCYIFRDTDGIRELTVREAAEKLIKIAKDAKQ
ncbi:hypothetical protein [Dyadobacter sp. OTU695]|uniref:hypothetical protein n=1 Tax=Dyadobacter sp. OTU695 TaxID=3043860 RepID=UPI00313B3776